MRLTFCRIGGAAEAARAGPAVRLRQLHGSGPHATAAGRRPGATCSRRANGRWALIAWSCLPFLIHMLSISGILYFGVVWSFVAMLACQAQTDAIWAFAALPPGSLKLNKAASCPHPQRTAAQSHARIGLRQRCDRLVLLFHILLSAAATWKQPYLVLHLHDDNKAALQLYLRSGFVQLDKQQPFMGRGRILMAKPVKR